MTLILSGMMTLISTLTILAILGIRTRYVVIVVVTLVVVVVATVIRAGRRRGPGFELRDLPEADSKRYVEVFAGIEREFIDRPAEAAARARGIAEEVMRRRGFPDRIEPEQRIRDLGSHDREAATALKTAGTELSAAGDDTDRLREVVRHYRTVVYRLTGTPLDRAA